MQIKFQTALITGSSRGLGRQIAVKLATEGVKKIAIHYRTGRSDAEATLSLIEEARASGVLVQGDVADPVVAENLVKEAAQKLGGCDIFVQSVCPPLGEIYEHVLATELSLEKWQLAFDTQARAFFISARTAAKFMRGGGRIIGMSYSQSGRTGGWQPWAGMGPAKAAMDSISRYFAVALGRHGITVNTVSPGMSDAGVMEQTPQEFQDAVKGWVESGSTAGHSRGYCGCLCVAMQRRGAVFDGACAFGRWWEFFDEFGFSAGSASTQISPAANGLTYQKYDCREPVIRPRGKRSNTIARTLCKVTGTL